MKRIFVKILKWTGYSLATLMALVTSFYVKARWSTDERLNKKYAFELPQFAFSTDSAILAEGARLAITKHCRDCHGDRMDGTVFIDDPILAKIIAPNLTKGKGGLPEDFNSTDWLRALKHGLKRDSTPLRIMPSHEFTLLAEDDVNALIAYCEQLEPVDHVLPASTLAPLAYILADLDMIPLIPAENIDHDRPLTKSMRREVSAEFGKYVSLSCEGCHRKNMKGGAPIAPGFPEVPDITSTGHPGHWTEQQFMTVLRTGETPEGKHLNPKDMPWVGFKNLSEVEMKALFMYLRNI
jgi:cytochrome c553